MVLFCFSEGEQAKLAVGVPAGQKSRRVALLVVVGAVWTAQINLHFFTAFG